jgi:hypothetical protein
MPALLCIDYSIMNLQVGTYTYTGLLDTDMWGMALDLADAHLYSYPDDLME